jgi:hypothetical protein
MMDATTNDLTGSGLPNQAELNEQLFNAILRSDAAAVSALLSAGVDVNANQHGRTTLMEATHRGDISIVIALLKAPGILINQEGRLYNIALTVTKRLVYQALLIN